MSDQPTDSTEQSKYELPYEEQPDDEWIRCPWADDPEVSEGKRGDYAKKCLCPNCLQHTFTDDPEGNDGLLKRLLVWVTGDESEFCHICETQNCTRESGECGWHGKITAFKVTDDGYLAAEIGGGDGADERDADADTDEEVAE